MPFADREETRIYSWKGNHKYKRDAEKEEGDLFGFLVLSFFKNSWESFGGKREKKSSTKTTKKSRHLENSQLRGERELNTGSSRSGAAPVKHHSDDPRRRFKRKRVDKRIRSISTTA
ncbi:hypothetical protein VNO77_08495 [Canavalia gladiata]|uniref:Uncharacterized protein n=1 Tax=Canavalia gladiata TaxID=3824 RepID=A0AAN9MA42_CANGL